VLLQSDVIEVAAAMRDAFEQHCGGLLAPAEAHAAGPDAVFFETPAAPRSAEGPSGRGAVPTADAAASAAAAGGGGGYEELQARLDAAGASSAPAAEASGDGEAEEEPPEEGGGGGSGGASSTEPLFRSAWAAAGWLAANPIGVPTEREHMVTAGGGRAYRVLLRKRRD